MKVLLSNAQKTGEWLDHMVEPVKYDFYWVTSELTLILLKNRATEPILHGETRNITLEEAQALADKHGRHLMTVPQWDWSVERAKPGASAR